MRPRGRSQDHAGRRSNSCRREGEQDGHSVLLRRLTSFPLQGLSISGCICLVYVLRSSADITVLLRSGQKQRIALGRAVYAASDVVLLDDILSAVDRSGWFFRQLNKAEH